MRRCVQCSGAVPPRPRPVPPPPSPPPFAPPSPPPSRRAARAHSARTSLPRAARAPLRLVGRRSAPLPRSHTGQAGLRGPQRRQASASPSMVGRQSRHQPLSAGRGSLPLQADFRIPRGSAQGRGGVCALPVTRLPPLRPRAGSRAPCVRARVCARARACVCRVRAQCARVCTR